MAMTERTPAEILCADSRTRFRLVEGGGIEYVDPWPACILIDGWFLDEMAKPGQMSDAFKLTSHVETDGPEPRFVWDTITFVCVNGSATYDLTEQRPGSGIAWGFWLGTLRA